MNLRQIVRSNRKAVDVAVLPGIQAERPFPAERVKRNYALARGGKATQPFRSSFEGRNARIVAHLNERRGALMKNRVSEGAKRVPDATRAGRLIDKLAGLYSPLPWTGNEHFFVERLVGDVPLEHRRRVLNAFIIALGNHRTRGDALVAENNLHERLRGALEDVQRPWLEAERLRLAAEARKERRQQAREDRFGV